MVTGNTAWDAARGVLAEADIIVDALLGTGLTGPVEGLLAEVISDVNAASNPAALDAEPSHRPEVVSVDMPSGLSSDATDLRRPGHPRRGDGHADGPEGRPDGDATGRSCRKAGRPRNRHSARAAR